MVASESYIMGGTNRHLFLDSTCKIYSQDPVTEVPKVEEEGLVEVVDTTANGDTGASKRAAKRKASVCISPFWKNNKKQITPFSHFRNWTQKRKFALQRLNLNGGSLRRNYRL